MSTFSPAIGWISDVPRAAVKSRAWVYAFSIIVVAVGVFSRLSYLTEPWSSDGAMFVALGKLTATGHVIGRDWIDNKLPTVGLITGVAWRIFGTNWAGYVLLQSAMAMLAAWRLTVAAGRAFGDFARLPTWLVLVTLLNLNAFVFGGFQLETMQVFFVALAAASALELLAGGVARSGNPGREEISSSPSTAWGTRPWHPKMLGDALLVGLAAGCAAMCKPTGVGVLAVFVIVAAWQRRWTVVATAMLGLALVAAVAIAAMEADGSLAYFPVLWRQTATYAANTLSQPADLLRPGILGFLFLSALLIRGWVYRREKYRVDEGRSAPTPALPRGTGRGSQTFVIAWLVLELAGVLMQRRMYAYHFLPVVAPAALCFAMIPRRATFGQLAGVLALPLALSIWGTADTLAAASQKRQPMEMAAWLNVHASPGDAVWRDHLQQVVVLTDLQPASRMPMTFLFMNHDRAGIEFSSMLVDDLIRGRPRWVVLPADVDAYVRENVEGVDQLQRSVTRATNFRRGWENIARFVNDEGYQPVATIGRERVYERQ